MNCASNYSTRKDPVSPVDAVAMKNAALRAVLGYLENKNGPGEWFKDELTYRLHRMVERALDARCDLQNDDPSRFIEQNQLSRQQC
jgi:hypothetical protein